MVVKRFEIYFVDLNPTLGSEINKIRPCVIVSPNEMNSVLNTVIVAPLTSTLRNYPTRLNCDVKGKQGQIALDQLRTIDKGRLTNRMGVLREETAVLLLDGLKEMFSY